MAGLFYFSKRRPSREKLPGMGLGYLVDGPDAPGPSVGETSAGPGGERGFLFAVPSLEGGMADLGQAAPEAAKWHQIPGTDLWVGHPKGEPAGPGDLARRDPIPGPFVRLADGAAWQVPVARFVTGATQLPRAMAHGEDGWTDGDVVERYRGLWEAACEAWDAIIEACATGEPSSELTIYAEADTSALALATNYRVSPAEITLLGLFDTQSQFDVIKALVDWASVEAVAKEGRKKKATEQPEASRTGSSSSKPGDAE